MRVNQYDDPLRFKQRVLPHLLENEAHSCVMLGVLSRLTDPDLRRADEPLPRMAAVEMDDGRTIAAGTLTLPYPLVVSRAAPEAASALAEHLAAEYAGAPGVVGATESAEAFTAAWARRTPCACRRDTRLGVYQTDRVLSVQSAGGFFRQATSDDMGVLIPWSEAFYREINEPAGDPQGRLRQAVNEERLFVWCDQGGPIVSMAAWAGPTPNGVRVNFVFTPPEFRRRGYASSCVAALTRKLLDSGRKFVFLFTDLSNPTSNQMYQRIGYRYLGDQQKILFDPTLPR